MKIKRYYIKECVCIYKLLFFAAFNLLFFFSIKMSRLTKILFFFIFNIFFACTLSEASGNRLKEVYNEAFEILVQRGDVQKLIDEYNLDYVTVKPKLSDEEIKNKNLQLKTKSTVEETIKENENDTLSRILKNKEVRIGAIRNKNWGQIGDYTAEEPTGFWPSLMRMVWEEISISYFNDKNAIKVKFLTYNHVFNALQLKNIDMTENFFLLMENSGHHKLLRNENHISNGQPVISHTNKFIVLKKHQLHDFTSFTNFINKNGKTKIGCLTSANCDVFKGKFHKKVKFVSGNYSTYEDLIRSVEKKKIFAAVVSGLDMSILDLTKFDVIESPFGTTHAPYFNSIAYGIYFKNIILLGVFVFSAMNFWF